MRLLSLAIVILLVANVAEGQNKKDPPAATPATVDDYAALNKQKEVAGKLVTFDPLGGPDSKIKKMLRFRYDYEITDVNPNYKPTKVANGHDFSKEIQTLQNKFLAANQMTNQQKRFETLQNLGIQQQQLMMRIAQEQNAYAQRVWAAQETDIRNNNLPYTKQARAKEFDLEIQDNVAVRRLKPALEYNDKGFIKEYTKDELEKLHLVDNKDGKLPGYPSKYEELAPKQVVSIYLKPGKKVEKVKSGSAVKADKTESIDSEPVIPLRPTVWMIVIAEDIPNPNGLDSNLPPLRTKKKQ